jgi:hypothetical protein
VISCRSPHPNAHRKLRPLHSFTYYATSKGPNKTLLSGNIPGPVRKVPPEESCNLGRFGVVVGVGVDGVHGGGWTENRDDCKKIVAQSYFLFSRFWTRNHVRSLIFERARRVAKRSLRLASSNRDPHRRFAKNHAKSLLFFGLPNGALLVDPFFSLFFIARANQKIPNLALGRESG